MLLKTAIRIILHEKTRFAGAVAGVALAISLVLLQWGFYFGYRRDTTVVINLFDADLWIVPKGQTSIDGFTTIDELAYWRAKELPQIDSAARIVWSVGPFRHGVNGSAQRIQLLGVDFDSGIRVTLQTAGGGKGDITHLCEAPSGPFRQMGDVPLSSLLRPDGCVLVGRKSQRQLGIAAAGLEGPEIRGRRATVVGFVENVHLFTTLGFVVANLDNARQFLGIPPSQVSYVACKCRRGADVAAAAAQLRAAVPEDDVLTRDEFCQRTFTNWETKTGIGPLMLFPSLLAGLVGFLMVTITFYLSTIQKVPLYASLKAVGAANGELVFLLLVQVAAVFALGSALAAGCLWPVITALRSTTIAVEITPRLVLAGAGALSFLARRRAAFRAPRGDRRSRHGVPDLTLNRVDRAFDRKMIGGNMG